MKQRILELRPNCLDAPTSYDAAVVGATMLWPGDETLRTKALSATTLEMMLINGHHPPPQTTDERRKFIELVRSSPGATTFDEEVKTAFKRGMLVGSLLRDVLFRHRRLGQAKQSAASTFGLSVSLINTQIWPVYRCVAAYWTAYVVSASTERDAPIPCRPAGLGTFLATAHAIKAEAEVFHMPQSPERTLLRPGETIGIPANISLPEGRLRIEGTTC